ncbi:MAG: PilX N-terminal domain-containing pilus assembly protein [Desulfobacterales bacterium]|nr:PilX N-terminal domain-containing pilus assembly protein [Desulfobacterales bacterium]
MVALRERLRIVGLQSQQGAALIIAVLILLILTVLGIYAITTSTLETKIAGNERFLKEAFYAADGGIDYGRSIIALVINNQSLPGDANPDDVDKLKAEILGFADYPDYPVRPTIGNSDMTINVDRIKSEEPPGYSGEFGGAVAEKQTLIYYAVDSVSRHDIAGTSSEIAATYRHVLHY